MDDHGPVAMRSVTTLRLGGPCRRVVTPADEAELVEALRELDEAAEPVLLLGGGSNLVVADSGFPGTVVRLATRGVTVLDRAEDQVTVRVAAGEPWDEFVAEAVAQGWSGVEALSGIPGLAGATPVQNVGAYGQEVSETVVSVRTYDRTTGDVRDEDPATLGFGYRNSRLRGTDRWVVQAVTVRLRCSELGAPVRYAELADMLGVPVGSSAPAADVRAAVLDLRRRKGMVLDPDDRDTWSAGSFFTNPVIDAEQALRLPPGAPRFQQPDGRVKTSAAWLIDRAGFPRGYGHGEARISTKHTLALTNRGSSTTTELIALAREIRAGVQRAFGVTLEPEPRLVGVSL